MNCKGCKFITLLLNKALLTFSAGTQIKVPSVDGIAKTKFWRDRIRDAETDNCVTVVKEKTQPAKAKKSKKSKKTEK